MRKILINAGISKNDLSAIKLGLVLKDTFKGDHNIKVVNYLDENNEEIEKDTLIINISNKTRFANCVIINNSYEKSEELKEICIYSRTQYINSSIPINGIHYVFKGVNNSFSTPFINKARRDINNIIKFIKKQDKFKVEEIPDFNLKGIRYNSEYDSLHFIDWYCEVNDIKEKDDTIATVMSSDKKIVETIKAEGKCRIISIDQELTINRKIGDLIDLSKTKLYFNI